MNRKLTIIIILAFMLTFGSLVLAPAPIVQGATIVSSVLPIAKICSVTTGTLYSFGWTDGQTYSMYTPVSTGSMTIDGIASSYVGVVMKGSGTDRVIGLWGKGPWTAKTNGAYHTVTWSAGTLQPMDYDGINLYTWPAGSMSIKLPPNTYSAWVTTDYYTPMSVSIAGPSVAAIGVPTTLGAVITQGKTPYEEQWTVFADRNGQDYSGTRSAANVNFSHTYLSTSAYTVRVKVWDSTGALVEATTTINGQSQKPVLHGQLLLNQAAGTMLAFGMYTDANSNPNGVVTWANCLPTSDYVVTWPEITITAQNWYQLLTASAYPNPLIVTTRYTEANGHQWTYSFSFDTTNLTDPGTYINSYGDSGHIEDAPPTWLQGAINWVMQMFKDLLKWAFVPTTAQMEDLMPGGSLGTALLDQTTWGTGSGEWNLTVHAGAIAIPLVDISFATIASWTFVTVIKTGIQAVMCVALVYMIVTLI